MKINIVESPFRPPTRRSVCSHLAPITEVLEKNGCIFDWSTGVIPDKAEGNILVSESDIDFGLIEDKFHIPDYIKLDRSRELIFCNKCWCAVEKKTPGKVYNSSIQPT